MIFPNKLVHGRLIKRYKRFLADVELDNGEIVVAHTSNSGSMKSCLEEGAEVYLTYVDDPKRKTKYTWEMIRINKSWVGINTAVPNLLVYEAVKNQEIDTLRGYSFVKREVKFGDSRFDVFASNEEEECFIEVKNVSMKVGEYARFPDAVTTRGKKHLNTLMQVKKEGKRAVMVYVIQRTDVDKFAPAYDIDPDYAATLKEARENGVEVYPIRAIVTPERIELGELLPFELE
ncbi:sugar fermentation stimulation protein SfsA [Labilibaculum manganireducens]|uniref:Sugar fermentation stimulation protein homolog n=1 Tax=Labilibaculum manganireducens TaxID=1940525 RepID=A0A2N3IGY0_9BACT|nr:DNA/RNA nuclease SfsA [Labilibaculum manganireducens]PKQ69518.1 sugar fermentation stimulation protein SfsA [Labilibaculum manganireducens]